MTKGRRPGRRQTLTSLPLLILMAMIAALTMTMPAAAGGADDASEISDKPAAVIVRFWLEPSPTALEVFETRFLLRRDSTVSQLWHVFSIRDSADPTDKLSWVLEDPLVCQAGLLQPNLSLPTASVVDSSADCSHPSVGQLELINEAYGGAIPEARPRPASPSFTLLAVLSIPVGLAALWLMAKRQQQPSSPTGLTHRRGRARS